MNWLALHLPALALEVYTRALPSDALAAEPQARGGPAQQTCTRSVAATPMQPPLAVSERERIVARNAAAARLGIELGLPVAAARALVADLRILPRKPAAEHAALARLAAWAMAFSDQVSLALPAALVLEAGRSLKLFGGAVALRRRVLDGVTGLGWGARCVLAPTPSAALVLAAAGFGGDAQLPAPEVDAAAPGSGSPGAAAEDAAHYAPSPGIVADRDALRRILAALPVAALGCTAAELDDLQRMGLQRIADLLRLPRVGFAERFGLARLHQLERLLGERPDPQRPFVPPERFRAELELPTEVPDAAALVFACRRLIDELGGFLLARQAGVQWLDWQLQHADAPPTRLRLGSAALARDPRHWLELLRERLDRLQLPAPVRAIAVSSERLRPLPPADGELFPLAGAATTPDPALLDRLRARLHPGAVKGLAAVAEHRPERAWRLCEPTMVFAESRAGKAVGKGGSGSAAGSGSSITPTARHDRPLWLLSEPVALALRDGRPWLEGPLDLGAGCERIDTGWWDGFVVTRDYYVARTADGERLWIYRDLRGAGGWFLHGMFG